MNIENLLLYFPYLTVVILLSIGLYAVLFKKNLIKLIMGITLMENGANLFLVSLAYKRGYYAPIFTSAESTEMVMPTAHALTLTSIVIGVATTALMLSFAIMIKKHYGSINTEDIRRCRE
ncbi:MAG: sodium:proton antiporter [Thermoplasmatota archaeon]